MVEWWNGGMVELWNNGLVELWSSGVFVRVRRCPSVFVRAGPQGGEISPLERGGATAPRMPGVAQSAALSHLPTFKL